MILETEGQGWHKTRCPEYMERPDPSRPLTHIQFKCRSRTRPFSFCPLCPARPRAKRDPKPAPSQNCFNFNSMSDNCRVCSDKRTGPGKICWRPHKRTKAELHRRRMAKRKRTLADQDRLPKWLRFLEETTNKRRDDRELSNNQKDRPKTKKDKINYKPAKYYWKEE